MDGITGHIDEKNRNYGVHWGQENPNPSVHRSSGKVGLPSFPLQIYYLVYLFAEQCLAILFVY